METAEKKTNFYDPSELLSHSQHDIFFSLGGRNIGKSTSFQKLIIRDSIKKNKKFCIIVKFDDDIKTFAANYFSQDWMDKFYNDYEIKFYRKTYYIRKKTEKKWRECGYAIALNKNASLKSTTKYHNVDTLIFEEFVPLEGKYIGSVKDPYKEPKLLQSVYQTIARGTKGKHTRRVRLICISNNYTLNNPYFLYFGILDMISKNKNSIYQRFYKYDRGGLHYVLEFSQLKPELTGIETDEASTGVVFKDLRNELKYTKDRPKKILFQLTFDNNYFLSIAGYNDSIIVFQDNLSNDKNILTYSCDNFINKKFISINLFKKSELYMMLYKIYNSNKIYYDKLESFINLTNILAW